jgi:hypothetical protein
MDLFGSKVRFSAGASKKEQKEVKYTHKKPKNKEKKRGKKKGKQKRKASGAVEFYPMQM